MTRRFLLFASTVLFAVSGVFTSCNDDDDTPDYSNQIVGQWLFTDENNTNDSYVISFGSNKKMNFISAVEISESHGYQWYTSADLPYTLNGDMLEISGKVESGIEFYNKIRINSIKDGVVNFTSLEYSLDGVRIPAQENVTYSVEKTSDNSSALLGVWRGVEPGSDETLFFYVLKANHAIGFYESGEDDSWTYYAYEKYYSYGHFIALLWKETTEESAPNFFDGYVWEKEDENTLLFINKKNGAIDESFVLIRAEESELPVIE